MRCAIAASALALCAGLASAADIPGLRYVGQWTIPTGTTYAGAELGGLSGIDYDPSSGSYYAIADDRSALAPARFYNLSMDFDATSVHGVTFNSLTNLRRPDGSTFPTNQVDPESIRRDHSTGRFFWTSEGEKLGADLQNPFVREMNADGSYVRELATPSYYNPTAGTIGIRRNLAFESLTLSWDGSTVYTATENALGQDGPAADVTTGSPCRVLSFDKATGLPGAEYVYTTDRVTTDPTPPGSFATNGLVELLAINDTEFLAVERSFSTGVGNTIKIYKTSLAGATDVSGADTLPGSYTAMTKTLVMDLAVLGITLDNIEGITLGPVLPDGSQSVVLCADNNFAPTQFTQFVVLTVPAPGASLLALMGFATMLRRRR